MASEDSDRQKFGEVVFHIKRVHSRLSRVGVDISSLKRKMKISTLSSSTSDLHERSQSAEATITPRCSSPRKRSHIFDLSSKPTKNDQKSLEKSPSLTRHRKSMSVSNLASKIPPPSNIGSGEAHKGIHKREFLNSSKFFRSRFRSNSKEKKVNGKEISSDPEASRHLSTSSESLLPQPSAGPRCNNRPVPKTNSALKKQQSQSMLSLHQATSNKPGNSHRRKMRNRFLEARQTPHGLKAPLEQMKSSKALKSTPEASKSDESLAINPKREGVLTDDTKKKFTFAPGNSRVEVNVHSPSFSPKSFSWREGMQKDSFASPAQAGERAPSDPRKDDATKPFAFAASRRTPSSQASQLSPRSITQKDESLPPPADSQIVNNKHRFGFKESHNESNLIKGKLYDEKSKSKCLRVTPYNKSSNRNRNSILKSEPPQLPPPPPPPLPPPLETTTKSASPASTSSSEMYNNIHTKINDSEIPFSSASESEDARSLSSTSFGTSVSCYEVPLESLSPRLLSPLSICASPRKSPRISPRKSPREIQSLRNPPSENNLLENSSPVSAFKRVMFKFPEKENGSCSVYGRAVDSKFQTNGAINGSPRKASILSKPIECQSIDRQYPGKDFVSSNLELCQPKTEIVHITKTGNIQPLSLQTANEQQHKRATSVKTSPRSNDRERLKSLQNLKAASRHSPAKYKRYEDAENDRRRINANNRNRIPNIYDQHLEKVSHESENKWKEIETKLRSPVYANLSSWQWIHRNDGEEVISEQRIREEESGEEDDVSTSQKSSSVCSKQIIPINSFERASSSSSQESLGSMFENKSEQHMRARLQIAPIPRAGMCSPSVQRLVSHFESSSSDDVSVGSAEHLHGFINGMVQRFITHQSETLSTELAARGPGEENDSPKVFVHEIAIGSNYRSTSKQNFLQALKAPQKAMSQHSFELSSEDDQAENVSDLESFVSFSSTDPNEDDIMLKSSSANLSSSQQNKKTQAPRSAKLYLIWKHLQSTATSVGNVCLQKCLQEFKDYQGESLTNCNQARKNICRKSITHWHYLVDGVQTIPKYVHVPQSCVDNGRTICMCAARFAINTAYNATAIVAALAIIWMCFSERDLGDFFHRSEIFLSDLISFNRVGGHKSVQ